MFLNKNIEVLIIISFMLVSSQFTQRLLIIIIRSRKVITKGTQLKNRLIGLELGPGTVLTAFNNCSLSFVRQY